MGLAATQVGVDLAVATYGCPARDEVPSRPPVGESEGRPYLRWVPGWPTVVSDRCSERACRIPARSSCRSGCKSQGCTRLLLPSYDWLGRLPLKGH